MDVMFKRTSLLALMSVAILAQVLVPTVAAGGPIGGNLDSASFKQVGRATLGGTSTCGHNVATGAAGIQSQRHYLDWTFAGPLNADGCTTIEYQATKNVTVAAYQGSFYSNTVATNLLGGHKTGRSCMGTSGKFSFIVPAGEPFVIVASECKPGAGGSVTFTIGMEPVTYAVDTRIRKGSGALVGDDVYDALGFGQTVNSSKAPGTTATFTVSIQNESNVPEPFIIGSYAVAVTGYKLKFFHGATDITSSLNGASFETPIVPAGGTFEILVKVKVLAGAVPGSQFYASVAVAPSNSPLIQDTVGLTVSRK